MKYAFSPSRINYWMLLRGSTVRWTHPKKLRRESRNSSLLKIEKVSKKDNLSPRFGTGPRWRWGCGAGRVSGRTAPSRKILPLVKRWFRSAFSIEWITTCNSGRKLICTVRERGKDSESKHRVQWEVIRVKIGLNKYLHRVIPFVVKIFIGGQWRLERGSAQAHPSHSWPHRRSKTQIQDVKVSV